MLYFKLVGVLKMLDEETLTRLSDYVHSPFFRVPPASVAVFDYLAELYPQFPEKKITSAHIEKLGKNLSNEQKQWRAGSELLGAVEHFIALDNWLEDKKQVEFYKFKGFLDKGLFEQFDTDYQKTMETLDKDRELGIDIFFYRHHLTELAFNGFDAKLNRTRYNDITPILKTLDEFYALKVLRYLCEVVSRKQVLGINYNPADVEWILKTLEPFRSEMYPYPYLFSHVYQMLSAETFEQGKSHYDIIKQFVADKTDEEVPESVAEGISYAVNWCLVWFNKGHDEMAEEYLWWTEIKIKYDFFLQDGKLLPVVFGNVMSLTAISNRPADWMLRFIKQYSPLLPAEYRDVNEAFAFGLYYYRTKDYKRAIQSFLTAQAKDEPIFNAVIRRWQWLCAYEQDPADTDLLLNQLHAFEKYLSRNEEAIHQFKTPFMRFIDYAQKLLNAVDRKERQSVKEELQADNFFPGKNWILKKLK